MDSRSIRLVCAVAAMAALAGCSHPAPPPAPVLLPLTDSASDALPWVQEHALAFSPADTVETAEDRADLARIAGDARIIGLSELTEGSHQFPILVRRALFALADTAGVRALAIQAPMPQALDIDRYVRTGVGDPRRLLRTLGDARWDTREMVGLVEAMRAWNQSHPSRQLGFYGFEIPTADHAIRTILSVPDSELTKPLHTWLTNQYLCVRQDEEAHWGLEGRASDSTFWNRCRGVVNTALDSIAARARAVPRGSRAASDLAFAEEMARLVQHHVDVGLRRLPREEMVAEHTMYLANSLGADAKLLVWGGDVEMGRINLQGKVKQMGLVLGQRLGERYRPIAFAFDTGHVRTRRPGRAPGDQGSEGDVAILPPSPNTYEDLFARASPAAFWLDVRALPAGRGGAWLHGPHDMRLITDLYVPELPEEFETPIELPADYDAILFVKGVSAAR